MSHPRIPPSDLMSRTTADTCILDVRTAAEVNACHLPGSIHIPLHELTPERLQAERITTGKQGVPIYLLCQAGRRAEMAADQLQGKIPEALCIVEGGMNALVQAGIPVQTIGRKVLSLERQVRIGAGSLVLLGAALGALLHPGFFGLSALVGAGLVMAGLTDFCPMGLAIARMPWNR